MGKTKDEELGGFLDVFELGGTSFSGEEVDEVVTEGAGGVEEIDQEVTEVEDGDAGEATDSEEKDSEKQVEEVVDVEEDASDAVAGNDDAAQVEDTSDEIEAVFGDLVNDDILIYDEEKEYEVGSAGLKELIKETIDKNKVSAREDYKKELNDKSNGLLDVLEKGGTVDDYIAMDQQLDYSKIPLETTEGKALIQNQKSLVEDLLKMQDYTDEEIQETLGEFEDSGMLKRQAQIAKRKLSSNQESVNKKLIKDREAAMIAEEEAHAAAAVEFRSTVVGKRELAGFKISKAKAEKLHDFITKQDKSGKTAFQMKDTEENRLLYAYMSMEDFDKDKLIKGEVTKQALKLKKKLSTYKDGNAAPSRGASDVRRRGTKDVVKDINWII